MSKDYYKILGVEKGATEDDIKRAYRKLAHQYHPDRPTGDEKRFKEINEAYQILSSKDKRSQYDRFGRVFEQGGLGQGGPFNFGDFEFGFGFDPNNVNFDDLGGVGDIFDMFFENLGIKRKRRAYQRGADLEIEQLITLEEAFRGTEKKIDLKTFSNCKECSGLGNFPKEGLTACSACNGRGEIRETRNSFFGNFSQVKTCNKCFGVGQIPNKICQKCAGSGRTIEARKVTFMIVPGIADGQIIKIANEGEAGERGAAKGDLYVRIKISPHSEFIREGDNLIVKKSVNLIDILLSKKIFVKTISGGTLQIDIPEDFNLNEKLKIKGEGMPRLSSYGRGDLYIQLEVKTPKKANAKVKKALDDLREELST